MGFLRNYNDFKYFGRAVYDIGACAFILSGITFINIPKRLWRKFLNTYFFWIILLVIITIPFLDFNYFLTVENRANLLLEMSEDSLFRIAYDIQMTNLALVPLILVLSIYFGNNKHTILAKVLIGVYLFFGFYYAKKNVTFELITLFFVLFTFFYSGKKKFKLLASTLTGLLIFIYVFADSVFVKRFTGRVDTSFSEKRNDRLLEADVFFDSFPFIDYVIGRGFGGVFNGTSGGGVLHIGVVNLIFKFGFIGLIILILFFSKNLIEAAFKRSTLSIKFLNIMYMFFLVFIISSPLWSWYSNMLYFSFMVFGAYIITEKNTN
tara:strand:- start:1227 stop:2189 length:963 start_codon:yes stop_codon:yes gene_type:complete